MSLGLGPAMNARPEGILANAFDRNIAKLPENKGRWTPSSCGILSGRTDTNNEARQEKEFKEKEGLKRPGMGEQLEERTASSQALR